MAVSYNGNVIGTMTVTQGNNKFNIEIRQSNCLAIFIHSYKIDEQIRSSLQYFFADEQHLKNCCKAVDKGELKGIFPYDEVNEIRLNMRYKESAKLLKHLVKYYEINCYYE